MMVNKKDTFLLLIQYITGLKLVTVVFFLSQLLIPAEIVLYISFC